MTEPSKWVPENPKQEWMYAQLREMLENPKKLEAFNRATQERNKRLAEDQEAGENEQTIDFRRK